MSIKSTSKLREVNGIDLLPAAQQVHIKGEIAVYEVPWLNHVVNDEQENFLLKWSDTDHVLDRWMFYRVPEARLLNFLKETVSIRDLILENPDGFVLFLDYEIQGGSQPARVVKVHTDNIPTDYLPDGDSYYVKGDFMYTAYCEELRQQIEARSTPKRPYKIQPDTSPSVLNEPPNE